MKKYIRLNKRGMKTLINKIVKESVNESLTNPILTKKVEKLDNFLKNTNNKEAKSEWDEIRERIMSQYNDDYEWEAMGKGDLEKAIENAEEIIDHYDLKEVIGESMEYNLLSIIVENVIREEDELGGDKSTDGDEVENEKTDNPRDVSKFLELADKYLFKKYPKYAEKINTTKEKAGLIAALAKKWGVDTAELAKVKSILSKENVSPKESTINEVGGYDDPNIMGAHVGTVIGTIRQVLRGVVLGMAGIDGLMGSNQKGEIMGNVGHLTELIGEGIELLVRSISDFTEDDLIADTKKLIGSLKRYNRKLRILESMGHGYDETDFDRAMLDTSNELTKEISKYLETLETVNQRFTKRFTGSDQGQYGNSLEDLN